MKIQKYLREKANLGHSIEQIAEILLEEHGVKTRIYPDDGVILLDYSLIDSVKTSPIVIECRSLILYTSDFSIASRKFDRFFNAGECPDYYSDFSLKDSVVFMKYDGSLTGVWFNKVTGRFEISTRGMAMAEGNHPVGGTFREKILGAMGFTEEQFQDKMTGFWAVGKSEYPWTLVMEYLDPLNRIVTRYEKAQMVLLGFNNGEVEFLVDELTTTLTVLKAFGMNVRGCKTYPIKETLADLVESANALTDLQEGFVVWDQTSGKRMKIKSSNYLLAHSLRGEDTVPTQKNLFRMVLEGDAEEFLVYFPEFTDLITEASSKVVEFKKNIAEKYETVKHITDQKEFALAIMGYEYSAFLFMARKMKTTPLEVFNGSTSIQKLKVFVS